MNSSTSEVPWLSPVAARICSSQIAQTQTALTVTVAEDILDAVDSGLFTSSTDVTSELSQDVQYCMALLNQGGYSAHSDGDNLVVSW